MPKNKIQDLRDHLFEVIEMLKDPESGMDIKTAKTIADVGQVIVNSAKVEADFVRDCGGQATNFFPELDTPETKMIN